MRRHVAVLAVAAAAVTAACGSEERELAGFIREPLPEVDTVALPDVSRGGEPFEMRAEDGQLLVVYFGYTNCPDICPTTLADLRFALQDLGDDAERIDLAMVTVDPERDTDVLAAYVQSFVDDAHALATSDPEALRRAAEPFGVTYQVTGTGSQVEVAHSTQLYVVDDAGRLLLTWQFGIGSEDLAGDLSQLLEQQDGSA